MKKIVLFIIVVIAVAGAWYMFGNTQITEAPVREQEQVHSDTAEANAYVGEYRVRAEESELSWYGERIVGRSHVGTVPVEESTIEITEESVSGEIVFDVSNLTSDTDRLTGHLKSSDFFDTDIYPQATYTLKSVQGSTLAGTLTIKDVEKEVLIPVRTEEIDGQLVISGEVVIDRTEFGITYESGSFFKELGDKAIADEVDITFILVLEKQ